MPAQKLNCTMCRKSFYACRSDTLFCSQRCRQRERQENAKFETPKIPKSGVMGVTYHRIQKVWSVKIKLEDGSWKYIGCKKTLQEAKKLQDSVSGKDEKCCPSSNISLTTQKPMNHLKVSGFGLLMPP